MASNRFHSPRRKTAYTASKYTPVNKLLSISINSLGDPHFLELLENRRMLSASTEANGYINVTPGAGDPLVYVDNVNGNDANAGTISAPVATITYGRTLLANLMAADPGHGGALLLCRGDVFQENLENWTLSGVSSQDPVLIGSYAPPGDTSTARPLLLTGTIEAGFSTPILTTKIVPGGVNYVDLVGIAFEDQYRDPTNSAFNPSQPGGNYGYFCIGASSNMLVEDCSFQYYIDNVTVEDGTSSGFGAVSNFTFEQNVISNSWVANSSQPGSSAKSEGLYAAGVTNITLDGNVFDHDGWSQTVPYAGANIYNHDCYLYDTNTGCVVTNNIFADAASHGLQARAGGIVENNLFLRDAIAMSFGFVNGAYSTPGGVSGIVSGNIVIEDKDISGAARGWGLEIGNLSPDANTVVENNIYAQDLEQANPAIQLNFGTGNSDQSQEVGINNLTIEDNTVYGFAQGLYINPGFAVGGTGHNALNNVTIDDNNFQDIQATPIIEDGPTNLSQVSWAGNTYSDASNSGGWFQIGNPATASDISFSQWQSEVEPTAQMVRLTYQDPTRTAATYNATLGGGNTLEALITQEDLQSNLYWRPQYATQAVMAYLRAGYTVGGSSGTSTVAVNAPDLVTGGSPTRAFTVTYTDPQNINTATLDNGNIIVNGPGNYSQSATLLGYTVNGASAAVTYSIPAPGGAWGPSANGSYTITLEPSQVADTQGNYVASGPIGNFNVAITAANPTASVLAPDVTAAAVPQETFTVTYADPTNDGISIATINSSDLLVTGPNGYSQPATFDALAPNETSDGTPLIATYQVTPTDGTWSPADDGVYTISVLPNTVQSDSGAFVPADTIGTFRVNIGADTTPPNGSAAAPDITIASSLPQTITVTWSDDVAVNPATIGSGNISVSGPHEYNQPVTFLSSSGTGQAGSPIVATYSLAAPAGGWTGSIDGVYYVVANPNSVTDTSGNSVAVGAIGAFEVNIDITPPVAEQLSYNIATATSANYPINVAYADASGINLSTLKSSNICVTGPNGYNQPVTYSGYTLSTSPSNILGITSPVIATYYLTAPAGGWTPAYNGTYTVVVQPSQVADNAPVPNYMPLTSIGTFTVAIPTTPTASITAVTPNPHLGAVGSINIVFSEPVTGLNLSALDLSDNGGGNLLSGAQTLTTSDDVTWTLGNLAPLTPTTGQYTLTLYATSAVTASNGDTLQTGASTSFSVQAIVPTATIAPVSPNPSSTAVNQLSIVFSEPVSGFTLSSLNLSENGGANLLTSAQTLTSPDQTNWTVGNLAPLTTSGGTYTLTLSPSSAITDSGGNALLSGATTTFTVIPSNTDTHSNIDIGVPVAAIADAYVRDGTYANGNFGSSAVLMAKDAIPGGGYVRYTYLTFNLQGVAPITTAVLQLYGDETSGSAEPSITLAAYPVANTSWAQNTITFNNAPAVGPSAINTLAITGTTPQNYTVDLTSYLQQQQALGNTLVSVALEGVQYTNSGTQFNSTLAATGQAALLINQGPRATITPVSPNPTNTAVSQISIVFNEPEVGFNLSSLTLTNSGGANLLTTAQTLTTTDNQTFVLGNLAELTGGGGNFTFTLNPAGITDALGNPMTVGASTSFVIDTTPPTVVITPVTPNPSTVPVSQASFSFSEPVTGVTLGALSLTDNGGPNLLTSAQTLTIANNQTFVLGNLAGLTSGNGSYTLTVNPGAGISDLAGNLLESNGSTSFVVNGSLPTASITPVASPTNMPVGQLTIAFNELVTGFALSSLSLTNSGGANLLTAAETLITTNNQTYVLGDLAGLTNGNGNYTLTLNPAGITDVVGNLMTSGASSSFVIDTTPPTVAITPVTPNPSTVPVSQVSFTFSKPVKGVTLAALSLTNNGGPNLLTSFQTLTTTDNQTFVLSNLSGLTSVNGVYNLTVNPGTGISDKAGNPLESTGSTSFVVDTLLPNATISSVASPTNQAIGQLTITFNEPVTGFGLSSLSLTNSGGANLLTSAQTLTTSNNQTFVLGNLTSLTGGSGAFTLTLNPAGITDMVGNALTSGASTSFVIDTTPPTVAVTPVTPNPSTAPVSQISFTFSEPVKGVTLAALSLTNNGGPNLLTYFQTLTTTNNQTFVLSNLSGLTSGNGVYTLTVNPGAGISDQVGNPLESTGSTSFVVDTLLPTATISSVASPTNQPVGQLTITFNEPVTGFGLSSLSLTSSGGANLLTSAQTLTTSNNQTFVLGNLTSLTGGSGPFTLTLNPAGITDVVGNALTIGASTSFVIDTTPPTVAVTPVTPNPSTAPVSQVSFTFSEPVKGVTLAALSLTDNGGPNLLTSFQTLTTTNNQTYVVGNLSGLTSGNGVYKLTVNPGAGISDQVGNPLESTGSTSFVVDTLLPTATISSVTSPSNQPVGHLTITFNEPVTGFGLSSLSLANGGGANLLTSAQTLTTTNNQTFVLGNLTSLTGGSGTFTLTLNPAGITDVVGNLLSTGASTSFIIDTTPPSVAITPVAPSPSTAPVSQIAFGFSEPVTGVSLGALALTDNGGPNLLTSAQTLITTNNQTFVLGNLSGLTSGNGIYKLTVNPGNGISDQAGNPLESTGSTSFAVDTLSPTVSITAVPSPTNVPVGQLTITFNEPVSGFWLSSLSLTNSGGANVLTSAQTLTTTNNQTYVLGNLASLTGGTGNYTLTLNPTGITDVVGNVLTAGASTSFVIDTTPPTVAITPVVPSQSVAQITVTFSEPVKGVSLAALSLTNGTGPNLLTSGQTLTTTDNQTFVLANLTSLTSSNGVYTLAVNTGAGITDLAGNVLNTGATSSFVVNITKPSATITPVVPSPGSTPVNQLGIVFDEPVFGFTLSSLTLTSAGGANLLTSAQTLTSSDQVHWTLGNLAPLVTAGGTFTLTLNPSSAITDSVGNSLAAGATISFTVPPTPVSPIADAYVRDGAYASQNFGTSTVLMAKDAISGGGYVRNTYLTFNLQGIAPITSAVLQLYGSETAGSPEPSITIAAYPVSNTSWQQSAITFNNAPAAGTPAIDTLVVIGTTPQIYSLDLTRYLQQQQALGITLASVVIEGTSYTAGGTQFNSTFAATNQPELFINDAQTVTGVSPSSGPTTGGTSVVITGAGFTGATKVWFGETPATSVTVNSDTQITAVDPAESAGVVDVQVTTPSGGTSTTSKADQFTYVTTAPAPTIVSVTPQDDAGNGVAAGSSPRGQRSIETQIQVVFSEPVDLASGAFALSLVNNYGSGTNDGSPDTPLTGVLGTPANPSGDRVTWIIPIISNGTNSYALKGTNGGISGASLNNGVYDLNVTAADVTAASGGAPMPANYTSAAWHRLYGDVDNAQRVFNTEYSAFLTAFGSTYVSNAATNYNQDLDVDGSGRVFNTAYSAFLADFGSAKVYTEPRS